MDLPSCPQINRRCNHCPCNSRLHTSRLQSNGIPCPQRRRDGQCTEPDLTVRIIAKTLPVPKGSSSLLSGTLPGCKRCFRKRGRLPCSTRTFSKRRKGMETCHKRSFASVAAKQFLRAAQERRSSRVTIHTRNVGTTSLTFPISEALSHP